MRIAFAGNPNSGKTTLFNLLTGNNAKVGNWPGVTIEKKSGTIKGTKHQITDLPGNYSLSPYSTEAEIARKCAKWLNETFNVENPAKPPYKGDFLWIPLSLASSRL